MYPFFNLNNGDRETTVKLPPAYAKTRGSSFVVSISKLLVTD